MKLTTHQSTPDYSISRPFYTLAVDMTEFSDIISPYILTASIHANVSVWIKYRINNQQLRCLIAIHSCGITDSIMVRTIAGLCKDTVCNCVMDLIRRGFITRTGLRRSFRYSLSDKGVEVMNGYFATLQAARTDIQGGFDIESKRQRTIKNKMGKSKGEDTTI